MATILCIDDNKNILQLHKALLEGYGHAVLIAADGASGIALSRNQNIDAIVLDFNMPGLDGGRVAEIIAKEQPTCPSAFSTSASANHRRGLGDRISVSATNDHRHRGHLSSHDLSID